MSVAAHAQTLSGVWEGERVRGGGGARAVDDGGLYHPPPPDSRLPLLFHLSSLAAALLAAPALLAAAPSSARDAKAAAAAAAARKEALKRAAQGVRASGKDDAVFADSPYAVSEDHTPNQHSHQDEGAKTAGGS